MNRAEETAVESDRYETPSIEVIGPAHAVTQGPVSGANPDATFPLHTSP